MKEHLLLNENTAEKNVVEKRNVNGELTRWHRATVRFLNGFRIVWKIFNEKRVWAHASVCGYATILSLVPILAISLSIISAFTSSESVLVPGPDGQQEEEVFSNRVFDFVFDHFLPGVSDSKHEEVQLAKKELLLFVDKTKSLRFIILIVLIIASVSLFNSIEHAFNEIWSVRHRRTFFAQFLAFWILVTITPLLLSLSYYYTTKFATTAAYTRLLRIEWGLWIIQHGISYSLTLFAFLIANRYLPNLHVNLIPALAGSALSAILWETAKVLFDYYMNYALSTEGYYSIFGTLAAIPLFICWLYYSYLCFLLGPVIANTLQNYEQHLTRMKRRVSWITHRPIHSLLVYLDICRRFQEKKRGTSLPQLEEIEGVKGSRIRRCLRDLEYAHLIHQDRREKLYYPNSDPDFTKVSDVLQDLLGLPAFVHPAKPEDIPAISTVRGLLENHNHLSIAALLNEKEKIF